MSSDSNASNVPALPSFFVNYEAEASYENEDPQNGLLLNDTYLPEEIVLNILSYIQPNEILQYSPVCRKWNRLIKSFPFWSAAYKSKYKRKAKKLPWYVFYCLFTTNLFDENIVINGNGEDDLEFWEKDSHYGNNIVVIDSEPTHSNPVPPNIPELNQRLSCFAIYGACCARQPDYLLVDNNLLYYVFNYYKPHIYLSEWTVGQDDCGSLYKLTCILRRNNRDIDNLPCAINVSKQSSPKKWKKIELLITEYPDNIEELNFEHQGCDLLEDGTGGCNMTGAVMKCLFDSIEPLPVDDDGKIIPKTYSDFKFTTTGVRKEDWPDFKKYFDAIGERFFVPFDYTDFDNLDIYDEYDYDLDTDDDDYEADYDYYVN